MYMGVHFCAKDSDILFCDLPHLLIKLNCVVAEEPSLV